MLNEIAKNEDMPENFKEALIVPIPNWDKDKTIKNKNRGITLISIMYKTFEEIMLNRETVWKNSVEDELQGVGQEKWSCLHTSVLF